MTLNKKPSFKYEKHLLKKGFKFIAGVDEVGRGAFAGPLVAAAVILPEKFRANQINDSKLLTLQKRIKLNKYNIESAQFYAISKVSVDFINKHGVGKANQKAILNCINKLKKCDYILVDGYKIKNFDDKRQTGIIGGDSISVSIAAASIIAKVYRDNLMIKLHKKYPEYNFLLNKGYGTKYHRNALKKYGLSNLHRTSFNLKKYLT